MGGGREKIRGEGERGTGESPLFRLATDVLWNAVAKKDVLSRFTCSFCWSAADIDARGAAASACLQHVLSVRAYGGEV